jgi:hypothetical protein
MGRITLHLKRFAHRSTTVESTDARWHVTRRPGAAAAAARPHARRPHTHTHEMSALQAAPRGWSTILESSGGSESFALESISQTQTVQQSTLVHVDREAGALDTLAEVGDEEVAGV